MPESVVCITLLVLHVFVFLFFFGLVCVFLAERRGAALCCVLIGPASCMTFIQANRPSRTPTTARSAVDRDTQHFYSTCCPLLSLCNQCPLVEKRRFSPVTLIPWPVYAPRLNQPTNPPTHSPTHHHPPTHPPTNPPTHPSTNHPPNHPPTNQPPLQPTNQALLLVDII